MTAKTVASLLRQAGYEVVSVSEADDLVDGMVDLAGPKHVQVGEDGLLNVVEELPGPKFKFYNCRENFNDVLEDLRA